MSDKLPLPAENDARVKRSESHSMAFMLSLKVYNTIKQTGQ